MTLYSFIRNVVNVIFKLLFRINITGQENIPKEGRLVICANHRNLLDPIMVAFTTKRPIHFMGKKELFENKFLNWFLRKMNAFPVNREASDIKAIKTSLGILKDEEILGIFPEGTRVDGFNKENAKSGISMIALKSKAPIVPIHIKSDYGLFKKVDIIVGEALHYNDLYGKKISAEEHKEISEDILQTVYNL